MGWDLSRAYIHASRLLHSGGDRRLSGLTPFQADYAEIHFSDTLLPDLSAEILDRFCRRRYSQ